ncbi:MAG: hypothetical protein QOF48_1849 [Verrucomicrobiota bacterium]|jgi:hypothetical protein
MNRSCISPEILQPYLDSATNAADKGQAQWFTPQAGGRLLARPLPQFRGTIVDLTCGRGDLLVAARNGTTEETLGADTTRAGREEPDSSKPDGVPAIDCIDFTLLELIHYTVSAYTGA